MCVSVLAALPPLDYILKPEHLHVRHQQKFFILLYSLVRCHVGCPDYSFFFFNILASLPLLLSTVYILLELPDLLKARLLCMFKYKSKCFFNGCIYFKVLEGRESEDVHVAEAAECMQEEVVFLWFCLVLL